MTRSSPLPLLPQSLGAKGAESRAGQQPPSSQLPPGLVSRTGTGKNGRPTWVWRGGGKGRYSRLRHLARWLQWLVPWWPTLPARGWRLPVGHAPVALGSPQLAHRPGQPRLRAQKLDPTRSSWSSCRAQGVAATNGPDHSPAAPRGERHARRQEHQDPARAGDGREGPRRRRDRPPTEFPESWVPPRPATSPGVPKNEQGFSGHPSPRLILGPAQGAFRTLLTERT